MDNNLTHKEVAAYYNDDYYRNLDPHGQDSESAHYRRLARKLNVSSGQSVLDVACGQGDWLSSLNNLDLNVYGIDISNKAIKSCRNRIPGGYFTIGLGEQLPFVKSSFDLVTCLGSLEHFLDQKKALEEISRVAGNNARILILVPNSNFLTARLGLYRGTGQARIRETSRSIDEWSGMFNSAGLKVLKTWKDLHILSRDWIIRGKWFQVPLRFLQAVSLLILPLNWQYQIYFLCTPVRQQEMRNPG